MTGILSPAVPHRALRRPPSGATRVLEESPRLQAGEDVIG